MFSRYRPKNSFDEYFKDNVNSAREILIPLLTSLDNMGLEELNRNHSAAKKLLLRHGATFRLNDTGLKGTERILPFDPCLLYTSPSPRDRSISRMPSSA